MIQFLLNFLNQNLIFILIALAFAITLSICSKRFRKIFYISISIGILYFGFLTYCKFYNYDLYKIFVKYVYYACIMFERITHIIVLYFQFFRHISHILMVVVGISASTLLCVYVIITGLRLLLTESKADNKEEDSYGLISNDEFELKYNTISKLNTVLRC